VCDAHCVAGLPLSLPQHRLVCVRMCVARNFVARCVMCTECVIDRLNHSQCRNFGVVARFVQVLRNLLVANLVRTLVRACDLPQMLAQTYGDDEKNDIEEKVRAL
jgi:hypothetical protein